jgi:flagellar hook-length control protein FliK
VSPDTSRASSQEDSAREDAAQSKPASQAAAGKKPAAEGDKHEQDAKDQATGAAADGPKTPLPAVKEDVAKEQAAAELTELAQTESGLADRVRRNLAKSRVAVGRAPQDTEPKDAKISSEAAAHGDEAEPKVSTPLLADPVTLADKSKVAKEGVATTGVSDKPSSAPSKQGRSQAKGPQDASAAANEAAIASQSDKPAPVEESRPDGRKERGATDRHAKGHEETVAEATTLNPETKAETVNIPAAAERETEASITSKSPKDAPAAQVGPANQPDAIGAPAPRLSQHFLSRSEEHSPAGKPLTEADQARFVQRVARAFQTAAGQEGELRLRLSPPELGSLRLEVKVEGGLMTARIEAESPTARSLLLDNLPALRERLAEQNIRLEQFDVDLMDRQGSGPPSGMPQDQGRQTNAPPDAASRLRAAEERADESAGGWPTPRGTSDGQLNVLV